MGELTRFPISDLRLPKLEIGNRKSQTITGYHFEETLA